IQPGPGDDADQTDAAFVEHVTLLRQRDIHDDLRSTGVGQRHVSLGPQQTRRLIRKPPFIANAVGLGRRRRRFPAPEIPGRNVLAKLRAVQHWRLRRREAEREDDTERKEEQLSEAAPWVSSE